MTTAALNGLWQYLQTLSLTEKNKRWLAEKLVSPVSPQAEDKKMDETKYIESSDTMMSIVRDGDEEIKKGTSEPIALEDLWK